MADALGSLVRVDLGELGAHRSGVVRAFGFADVAVDAIVGNHQCHGIARSLLLGLLRRYAAGAALIAAIFFCSQRSTDGKTNFETSPPSMAISRTMVPEMN